MRLFVTEDNTSEQDRIEEAAALWHTRLEAGTANLDAFNAWRDEDPRHSVAFSRVLATSDAIDDLRGFDFSDDPDLRTGAGTRRIFMRAGAAAAVVAVGAGVWAFSQRRASASTNIGERRLLQLPDRISVELNTDTRVEWKQVQGSVRLWLLRGEVAVSVPKGQKPCVLETPAATAEISGDVNARLRASALDLTVLRGACVVKESTKAAPQRLESQQSILAGAGAGTLRNITPQEVESASAWRTDTLEFMGQPLALAVEEYNRYLTQPIVIIDPDIGAIRVGGRFSSRDPEGFLQTVQSSFGVRVSTGPKGEILLTKSERPA